MGYTNKVLITIAGSLLAIPAWSQLSCDKSYGFRVDVNSTNGSTLCAARSDEFITALSNFEFYNKEYTNTSPAIAYGRFNDVNVRLFYDEGKTTLNYDFREIGISGKSLGDSRSAAEDNFIEFIKQGNIFGQIMNYQAKNSPTSPIAGVGGIIPAAGASDYSSNMDTVSKVTPGRPQEAGGINNLTGTAVVFGRYTISGRSDRVTSVSLPLSYTIRNDIDPRRQLIFSMPLARIAVGDAQSYQAGLGVSYRFPVSDQWTVTPGGKVSVIASKDRATLSSVWSASVMSTYQIPLESMDLAFGNMLGYYRTGKFSSGEYSANPEVALTMTRNGIMLSSESSMLSSKLAIEYSFVDTRYIGNKPYISNSQEFGVTIGTNKNASNARSFTRAGLSYFRARDTRGLQLNFGYWF